MHALTLLVPQALVEQASDALLFELDGLSVTVEDADAGGADEQALFGEPGMPAPAQAWQRSRVVALFVDATTAQSAADQLVQEAWTEGQVALHGVSEVPDADWVRLTQAQFDPVRITDTFWIVPTWHQAPAAARRVLRLDPGLAFGSGTHPTTQMCLRWVAEHMPRQVPRGGQSQAPRVLDYGCGSGILAIAAGLHGAGSMDAVDIDPAAVVSTQANALANGVVLHTGLPDQVSGTYDVVLANILATPLKLLAPVLGASLAASPAHLVLAGILERQVDDLRAAYAPWCDLQVQDQNDGWVLMTARR